MLMIDTFVVNVAFPAIARSLHASVGTAGWTVSGYVLVMAVLPVAMGRLGDLFGRRRIYIAGLALFLGASIACGFANGIGALIVFRVLQGVGGATMMPGTLSITTRAFPPQQRGLAIGIWGGVSGLGLIAGPILGGLLVQGDSWRWIFFINVPIGVVALLMAVLYVPESYDESAPRTIDWAGLLTLSGALCLIMLGLTWANDDGWSSARVLGGLAVGVALLPLFVAAERRISHPLVDLSLFRSGTFVAACLAAALSSMAIFGSQPYQSLFLQNTWGFSPLQGGLAFIPATALVALMMPVSGVLGQRLGRRLRLVVIAGSLAVAGSFLLVLRLDAQSGYADGLLGPLFLRGIGVGLLMSSTSLAVMSAAPLAKAGLASGALTMSRNIGTAVGVALLGTIFASHLDTNLAPALATLPAGQAARVAAAAHHFAPAGTGATLGATRDAIVQSFVWLAAVAALLSLAGTGAALFIRHRPGLVPAEPGAPAEEASTQLSMRAFDAADEPPALVPAAAARA
jgi:EmrB/QacA subfamily drug resistance transporter